MAARWHPVADLNELIDGRGKLVRVEGKTIALFRVEDDVFATDNQFNGWKIAHQVGQAAVITA